MTTKELTHLSNSHVESAEGLDPYTSLGALSVSSYRAGFTKQNELAIALLQQKQAAIINRHVEFSSDKQVLAVLRELLEELTIQP